LPETAHRLAQQPFHVLIPCHGSSHANKMTREPVAVKTPWFQAVLYCNCRSVGALSAVVLTKADVR
jgi:hypothetical protein